MHSIIVILNLSVVFMEFFAKQVFQYKGAYIYKIIQIKSTENFKNCLHILYLYSVHNHH